MKLTQIIATATTAAVLGTAGISIAGATADGGNASKPSAAAASPADGNRSARRSHHRRIVVREALGVAADTIGIDRSDLVKELRAGKTIAEVATAHNVDPQHVVDALVQAATKKIEAAETAGKITAERAAKLEQRLPDVIGKLVNNKHAAKGAMHRRAAFRKILRGGVKVAADTIGIAPKDLVKELRAGKTIAEVATAHNVDPQHVVDALVQAATKKIEAAKTAGKITAERAAKLEERAPARIAEFVNEWHPRAGA
jgi:uncharacterized protein (DUF433 family)